MAAHVYHEIYLHLTWHTKHSQPLLHPKLEHLTFKAITDRISKTKGVWLHGINGTATHVHLAINIEPSITISDLVKDLKGGSAHDVNSPTRDRLLEWQRGYGVVSFGANNLPWVLDYIEKQKQHHAANRIHKRLEAITMDEQSS